MANKEREAVLISIQPKWCEKIANCEKTVEIRKTRPKLKAPFKCYIYCTKPKFPHEDHITLFDKQRCLYAGGKVIGEFICNEITSLFNVCTDDWQRLFGGTHEWHKLLVKRACLSEAELREYAGGKFCCAWHITDLVIYEEPKGLGEFSRKDPAYEFSMAWMFEEVERQLPIKKAPQSWCYVEEYLRGGLIT